MHAELHVIVSAQRGDIGHDVVGAIGRIGAEPQVLQHGQREVPPLPVFGQQSLVVIVRQGQRHGGGLLQGVGCPHCEKVVDLANG